MIAEVPPRSRVIALIKVIAPVVLLTAGGVFFLTSSILVKGFLIFTSAIILFALEDELGINKAPTALVAGVVLLILARTAMDAEAFEHHLTEMGGEIIQIVVFLFAAVLNAAMIVHHRAFDRLRTIIYHRGWGDVKQFTVLVFMVAGLSAIVDNLTATVIGLNMALLFFKNEKNVILATVAIIIAANAGGAPSPVGDLTTTILWVNGLYTAQEIITLGLLPNLVMLGIPFLLLRRKLESVGNGDSTVELVEGLTKHEKVVIVTAFLAFLMPVVLKSTLHVQPWISLSLGFGITWLVAEALPNMGRRMKSQLILASNYHIGNAEEEIEDHTAFDVRIEHQLKEQVAVAEIFFFVGVLFMVTGLRLIGALQPIADLVYGSTAPEGMRLIMGHTVMGLLSAVFDNIPLVEMVRQMLDVAPGNSWVLLAAAAGNGGSLLFYGSAAGVVAYGILRSNGYKFGYIGYLKIVTVPVLLGYVLMIGVWYIQYLFVGM